MKLSKLWHLIPLLCIGWSVVAYASGPIANPLISPDISHHLEKSRAFMSLNTDSMEYHAQKALDLAMSDSSRKGEGEARNLMAGVAYRRGNLPASLDYALDALHCFEVIDDSLGQARMHSNLSIIYRTLELYEKGYEYASRGVETAYGLGDSSRLGALLIEQARILLALKRPKEALNVLFEAKMFTTATNDADSFQDLFIELSHAYSDLGQSDSSLYFVNEALALLEDSGNELSLLNANMALGYHHLKFGEPLEAMVLLEYAYSDALKLKNLHIARRAQDMLKKANRLAGNFQKALYHDSIQEVFDDSLFSLQKATAIASLQSQFELDYQILENKVLVNEQQAQAEQMRQAQMANNIMAWLLALVVAGGTGLWFIFRRVRKLNGIMKNQREEILTTNERLHEMIEESHQQNEQIQEKNKNLQELNAYKDKLFSLISHDFRSPLSSVISLLKVLEQGLMTPEESRVFAKQVGLRVQHTFQLVSNLLFWSRSQMRGVNPNPQAFNIEETLHEVKGVYHPIAEAKWVQLNMDLSGSHKVYADPDMVQTVVRNLVSNAIKYTPNQGSVNVVIQEGVSGITIAVEDTGLGMDAETKEKLFADHVTSRLGTQNEKGTGIGLALSKDFVDLNDGKIWVESMPNEGSTFFLYLPSPIEREGAIEAKTEPTEFEMV